jgi:DNA-binding CsgD family transcriptional regulator
MDAGLIGRDGELSRLRGILDRAPAGRQVLLLLGDPGMGKTVLLAKAARWARFPGMTVLSVVGWESERDLAFAGLYQLLEPVLDRVPGLPDRQAGALLGAFALSAEPAPPDALLTGLATLTLLSALSQDRPLLVVVDDAQWLDPASLDALAFAARRLDSEPIVLLLGARGDTPPSGFERVPAMVLEPLSTQDAERLLDLQPHPPRGQARAQVLAQAAGNPMALIELAKVIVDDPAAGRRWSAEPLPPTGRLTAVIGTAFAALPQSAKHALLLAAVADTPALAAGLPELSAQTLAPAESAGLIRLASSGPQFTHPLVRAAVYHRVPFAERAAAHLLVAETVRDAPDRYAWHLAAATLEPDERVASLLEESASHARRRGGLAAAARALERAAELSPAHADQARRLLAAAALARIAGQAGWGMGLASQVLGIAADPDDRIRAQLYIGWALIWSSPHGDAPATLLRVAAEASVRLPALAWHAVTLAATAAYHTGNPEHCRAVLRAMDELPEPPVDWSEGLADAWRTWIRAATGPFSHRGELIALLRRLTGITSVSELAPLAWLLDETELAVTFMREYLSQLRTPGARDSSGPMLSALHWACIESGRWDEALAAAREAVDAGADKLDTVAASSDLAMATVAAMRGDHDQVRPLLDRVFSTVDAAQYRAVAARARHAAGLSALAEGDYQAAYAQLSQLFDTDGTPLHHHVSYLGIADFAAAAARAERQAEARTVVDRALARVDPAPGPRLEQLAARARGLLAEPASAEAHFSGGLSGHAGDTWPFERAQLRLDYGEWLRRQRRINDAKPVLLAAMETFRRLGAAPWTRRAETELRACGVIVDGAPVSGVLSALTAQQREIVILASRGLSNDEIAERLFLSPHTVATHLSLSYPKLGIAGRHQLRDLLD